MSAKFLARVLGTERTTGKISSEGTMPDFAFCAARKQSPRFRTASIAVRDILREQVHAVLLLADSGDVGPHGLLFGGILLQRCKVDWASAAIQTAITKHGIHSSLAQQKFRAGQLTQLLNSALRQPIKRILSCAEHPMV
jgi:hypothetical protein